MKIKYILLIFPLLLANHSLSQIGMSNLAEIESFCCYEWLPEFNDSIKIVVNEEEVNQRKKYCVITKRKKSKFDLHCWTGSPGLETPTEWKERLKIKFKGKEEMIIKFGKKKATYRIEEISEKIEYLLIKKI